MQLLLESPQTFRPYSTTQLIFTNSKKTYLFEGDKKLNCLLYISKCCNQFHKDTYLLGIFVRVQIFHKKCFYLFTIIKLKKQSTYIESYLSHIHQIHLREINDY